MPLRIVFMGTPDFAVPTLRGLLEAGYEIVGVITATDKMGGRGGKQRLESAVKRFALRHHLHVLQPPNLKAADFIEELRSLEADLQIVVAFRMLPEVVWAMPPMGTFNLHASLLPKFRGAAPINWAIIRGEQETGVTTFFIQHQIDTGDLLLQRSTSIGPDDTAGDLHDRLMEIGSEVVLETVRGLESGTLQPKKQDDTAATPAPKLFRDTCRIDFQQPAQAVHNFVRGLHPYPTAWTTLDGQELKILRTQLLDEPHSLLPGTIISDNKLSIRIACGERFVEVLELQLQGRKRMPTRDFLNGFEFAEGQLVH